MIVGPVKHPAPSHRLTQRSTALLAAKLGNPHPCHGIITCRDYSTPADPPSCNRPSPRSAAPRALLLPLPLLLLPSNRSAVVLRIVSRCAHALIGSTAILRPTLLSRSNFHPPGLVNIFREYPPTRHLPPSPQSPSACDSCAAELVLGFARQSRISECPKTSGEASLAAAPSMLSRRAVTRMNRNPPTCCASGAPRPSCRISPMCRNTLNQRLTTAAR